MLRRHAALKAAHGTNAGHETLKRMRHFWLIFLFPPCFGTKRRCSPEERERSRSRYDGAADCARRRADDLDGAGVWRDVWRFDLPDALPQTRSRNTWHLAAGSESGNQSRTDMRLSFTKLIEVFRN